MMWYGAGWMGLFGPLMMVLFWGGLILLVVWGVRGFAGPARGAGDAVDILKRRLAAGEITTEQYEQARKALQG